MSSEVETSREATRELGHGMESLASPRMVSGLRCSLDSARNDIYAARLTHGLPLV
jgi:hypothetical protein